MKSKDIKISEENWRFLMNIKLKENLKSMDKVISYLKNIFKRDIELKGGSKNE